MNLLADHPASPCLQEHSGNIQYCVPPSDWNPENVSSLAELRVSHLLRVVPYNQTYDRRTNEFTDVTCGAASNLLPIKELTHLNNLDSPYEALQTPALISVGALELAAVARQLFPSPLNASLPGAVVDWWVNATANDATSVTEFLEHVARECWYEYCKSDYISIGNPDIVGYGMFLSAIMLITLTVIFASLSLYPIRKRIITKSDDFRRTGWPGKLRFNFRLSLVRTLPGLMISALVFAMSVMVSSYVYRWTTHSRFDALMADAFSMLSATAVVMICAAYWATTVRPYSPGYVAGSVVLLSILNLIMFSTHFSIFYKRGKMIERLCSQGYESMTPDQRFQDSEDFFYFLGGFVCYVLALLGMVTHHPLVRKHRAKSGWAHAVWVVAETLPVVAGSVSLAVYSRYYWKTREIMKDVYGDAFTAATQTWGFGQYLALATWFPPILQFLYLYFVPWARRETDVEAAQIEMHQEKSSMDSQERKAHQHRRV
ncbi:hypothetical protein QBC47DRAFT_303532 [Echria macrotheca]|uniref:Uncharacterized protein n=1 Tax=Echria macrotheca TaxID=438768 RepID=A0AAJ0F3R2_9PEZI|nr:hypothetical protein QBC47DRAFT_303532 [Echria macrotheca]